MAAAGAAAAADLPAGQHALGSPTAPVVVDEYASVGCPHCAEWATEVFPAFRRTYIDTGKARFVFHELIAGDPELAVAGFMIADCVAPDRYFQVVDAIFSDQAGIARGGGEALLEVAKRAGLTPQQFDACLTDKTALETLQARTAKDAEAHGVKATPTFLIDGRAFDGVPTLQGLGAAIDAAAHAHRKG